MPLPESALPVRMRRIAVIAPRERLRDALVALADDGGVELSGELPALVGPPVDALRRLEREPDTIRGEPRISRIAPDLEATERAGDWSTLAGESELARRAGAAIQHGPVVGGRGVGRRGRHRRAAQPARSARSRARGTRVASLDRPADAAAAAAGGERIPAAGRHLRCRALRGHRPDAVRRRDVRAHVRDDVRRRRPRPGARRCSRCCCAARRDRRSRATARSGRCPRPREARPPSSGCSTARRSARRGWCRRSGWRRSTTPSGCSSWPSASARSCSRSATGSARSTAGARTAPVVAILAPSGVAGLLLLVAGGVALLGWYRDIAALMDAGLGPRARRRSHCSLSGSCGPPGAAASRLPRRSSRSSTPRCVPRATPSRSRVWRPSGSCMLRSARRSSTVRTACAAARSDGRQPSCSSRSAMPSHSPSRRW